MTAPTLRDLLDYRSEKFGVETPLPATAQTLLYFADLLVQRHLLRCAWDPDNEDHVKAIREAILLQATIWVASDIDPLTESFTANIHSVQSASLLGGSFSNSGAGVTGMNRSEAANTLQQSPLAILELAGIEPPQIRLVG